MIRRKDMEVLLAVKMRERCAGVAIEWGLCCCQRTPVSRAGGKSDARPKRVQYTCAAEGENDSATSEPISCDAQSGMMVESTPGYDLQSVPVLTPVSVPRNPVR